METVPRVLDLVKTLTDGLAEVAYRPSSPQESRGHLIEVTPLNPHAAKIALHLESEDAIEIFLGEGARTQLEQGKGGREELLRRLDVILRSVINGQLEETYVRSNDGHVVRSRARLVNEEKTQRYYYNWMLPLPALWPFERKKVFKSYQPYRT